MKMRATLTYDTEDERPFRWAVYEVWDDADGEERSTRLASGRSTTEREALRFTRHFAKRVRKSIAYGVKTVEL